MEFSPLMSYALEWVNLLLRWTHVIVAIAWIGSSNLDIRSFALNAEIVVLLARKAQDLLRAKMMMFDVTVLVLAVRHIVIRQVGDLRQFLVERGHGLGHIGGVVAHPGPEGGQTHRFEAMDPEAAEQSVRAVELPEALHPVGPHTGPGQEERHRIPR